MSTRESFTRNAAIAIGAGLILVAPTLVYLVTKDGLAATFALVSATLFTLLLRFDEMSEVAVGPLRVALSKKIEEATATLAQLRTITRTISRTLLTDLASGSFMDGMSTTTRLALHDEVIAELKSLGMSGDEIRDVETDWRKAMGVIYWRAVGKALEPSFAATGPTRNDTVSRWNALLRIDTWHTPSPAEMERFCANEQLLVTPDAREWLEDYRHFLEHNSIRRRDKFVLQ